MKHIHHVCHGMTKTITYESWKAMMTRCFNQNHPSFPHYSKLQPCEFIKSSPMNLLVLIGERPNRSLTLDRIVNTKGYHCGQCAECMSKDWVRNIRWASRKQQGRNRSNNKPVDINGVSKTIPEWSEELGVPISTLRRWYVRDYYHNPVSNESAKN